MIPSLKSGGSERVVTQIIHTIDPEKFEIILMVSDMTHAFYKIDENRAKIIDFKTKSVGKAFPKIRKAIQEEAPDIVFSTVTRLNLFFALLKSLLPKRPVYICRESNIVSIITAKEPSPMIANWIVRNRYGVFDRIICQSNDMKADLVGNFGLPF